MPLFLPTDMYEGLLWLHISTVCKLRGKAQDMVLFWAGCITCCGRWECMQREMTMMNSICEGSNKTCRNPQENENDGGAGIPKGLRE